MVVIRKRWGGFSQPKPKEPEYKPVIEPEQKREYFPYGKYFPLIWRDEKYIDVDDFIAENGFTKRNVRYHLETYGHLDNLGAKTGTKDTFISKSIPLNIAGRNFSSMRDLARKTGKPLGSVQRWVKENKTDKLEQIVKEAYPE